MFSYETLTEEGNQLDENIHISLLADDDLVYLMKNVCSDETTKEYFNRQNRRHPIWKSEAEYKSLFYCRAGADSDITNFIEKEIDDLSKYVINITGKDTIDESTIEALKKQIEELNSKLKGGRKKQKEEVAKLLKEAKKHLSVLECMYDITVKSGVVFDLLILRASQFNSGFVKKEFAQLPILFPDRNRTNNFGKIVNSINAEKTEKNDFFYIFYRRESCGEQKKSIDAEALVQGLADIANNKGK